MTESVSKAGNTAPSGVDLPPTDLVVSSEKREQLNEEAKSLASLQLSSATAGWLQMMAIGALSPIERFMGRADYESVRTTCRLADGSVFPVPLILPADRGGTYREGERVALRNSSNHVLAVVTIEEVFEIAGTSRSGPTLALSGRPEVLRVGKPLLFSHLYKTPVEVRRFVAKMDCGSILAADQWDPRERGQGERLRQECERLQACLLLNVFASSERLDDFDSYIRLRDCASEFEASFGLRAILNYLPAAIGVKTVRRILLNAVIHRNFGADYYLFDPPSPGEGSEEDPACISAGALPETIAEVGLQAVIRKPAQFGSKAHQANSSKTPASSAGFCVWFTGLPGAGKSTIAEQLMVQLMERGRRVTLLDGDIVRTQLSRGLTFSRADRDINVQRIGFVASEIVRHGGVAVCAAVSPYQQARSQVRRLMGDRFVEIFVDTPVDICERRDVKGFYAKARSGQIQSFTGVDDPYEPPEHPDIRIATAEMTPQEGTQQVMEFLLRKGYLDAYGAERRSHDSRPPMVRNRD
jgi:sulfate adenylyltransferase